MSKLKNVKTNFIILILFQILRLGFSEFLRNETGTTPEYLQMLYSTGQYKHFSEILHIENADLVRPSNTDIQDPMFNKELDNGDILLAPWQHEKARQGEYFSQLKWENYVVPYTLIKEGYTEDEMTQILVAIYYWNMKVQNIQYRRRTDEKDYVVIFNGNGCYSNIGRITGQQSLSLSSKGCLRKGTILHEMAHTVGLVHEHTRPDRDDYIHILDDNIPDTWKSQYEKTIYENYNVLGKYDYYSVMHYRQKAPQTGQPAFQILQGDIVRTKIGQREDLTRGDIGKIRKLYS